MEPTRLFEFIEYQHKNFPLEIAEIELTEEKEKVLEAGGLCVIGTERHESRRIDKQLRGRSGRQGDPGSTKFFLSLEDDLMRIFASERIFRQNIFVAQNVQTLGFISSVGSCIGSTSNSLWHSSQ